MTVKLRNGAELTIWELHPFFSPLAHLAEAQALRFPVGHKAPPTPHPRKTALAVNSLTQRCIMVTGTCMPVVIFRSIWNAIIPHIPRGGTKVPKLAENSQSAVQSCVLGWGRGSAAAWLALPHTAWPVPACPAPLLAHTGAKAAQTPPAQGNSPSPDVQESTSMAVARVRCWECLVRGRDGLAEVWRGRDSWEPSGF